MSMAPPSPMAAPEPHDCPLCDDDVSDRDVVEILLELGTTTAEDTLRVEGEELCKKIADTYDVNPTAQETVNHVKHLAILYGGGP